LVEIGFHAPEASAGENRHGVAGRDRGRLGGEDGYCEQGEQGGGQLHVGSSRKNDYASLRTAVPRGGFHSHAAPRTPLASPCIGGTRRVRTASEKIAAPQCRGTAS